MSLIEREVRDLKTLRLIGYLGLENAHPRFPGVFPGSLASVDGKTHYDLDISICAILSDTTDVVVYSLVVVSHDCPLEWWKKIANFREAPNPLMEWLEKAGSAKT